LFYVQLLRTTIFLKQEPLLAYNMADYRFFDRPDLEVLSRTANIGVYLSRLSELGGAGYIGAGIAADNPQAVAVGLVALLLSGAALERYFLSERQQAQEAMTSLSPTQSLQAPRQLSGSE
jgi:hypothetical protein